MNQRIDRRRLLRFGVALPLAIESLSARHELFGSQSRAKSQPRRVLFICNSLGFYGPSFFPRNPEDLKTSEYLGRMRLVDKLTVFGNLFHPGMQTSNHDSEKSFLTGKPNPEASNFVNGISLDQVLAKSMGNETRFGFLSFSIYNRGWGCSWNDRGVAIPPMHDEEQIFDMLFGAEDLQAKQEQLTNDTLILEALKRDMDALKARPSEASKLETYSQVIRELETQLDREKFWLLTEKPKVTNSLSRDKEFEFSTKIQNLFELTKLAFRTDSTRVITISMDWIYGAIKVPGASGGWHTLSHHGGNPEVLANLSCVERDILKHFDQFLWDMDQIADGQGSLLDHTTIVFGSNFGNSSDHTCDRLPILVAGGGTRHQGLRLLDPQTPLCNLYLELLHKHDIDVGSFGTSQKDMGLL
ncbi:MAG: DUF1552 domain-containing protein [Planctomycetaceae bacterium]|jgi:hypothetical protein|nr:DUF1552 domain-containing protein [Planctomycetaceae bacterium]MCE2813511.1 DUF1552 domain-containing protein [Planctomycetaceae bacterium]